MSGEHESPSGVHQPAGSRLSPDISHGQPGDIDRLIEIDRAASSLFAPTGLLSAEALADHVPAKDLRDAIASGWLLVARLTGAGAIGFVMASPRGEDLYVDQISVDPAYGQRGAGRLLMHRLEELACARGLPAIALSTFRELRWNAPFYASIGYRELKRDAFASYMLEIEAGQTPFMDVTKRTFMRKQLRKPPFDDTRRT